MATSLQIAHGSTARVVPNSQRLTWRVPYGDIPSLVRAAEEEAAHGHFYNAWAAYQFALTEWLYRHYLERLGKKESTIRDPHALLQKLRSCQGLDRWQMELLRHVLTSPRKITIVHVDMLACIVRVVTEVKGGASWGAE